MAAPGSTPIQHYHTTTAAAQPIAGNLAVGELALNVTDKKGYTKDGGGNVIQVMSAPDATETLTNKTISVDNNTLSGVAASSFVLSNASGNIDGAAAQKAIPSGVVVGTTDTQTLTNKTLTDPGITLNNAKTTPVDADEVVIRDSAASFSIKKLTWANLKAAIATYYNDLTATLSNKTINAITNGAGTQGNIAILGDDPEDVPQHQELGALAYQDFVVFPLDVGTGITTGVGTLCRADALQQGGVKSVRILIDLTGLNSGNTAGDIIGVNGTTLPCYITRLPPWTILGVRMTCLETPAGGDTDIDLYAATEGTGVEDGAITALTETQIINAGAQTAGTVTYAIADPAANTYLYLVGQGTANATYTAGRFLIEIFGV